MANKSNKIETKIEKVMFTEFRRDLASYLEKLANGEEIQVMNARRGKLIVSLVKNEAH